MNAAEQATDLHLASKLATVVNLFKQQFPDARADLKPWSNDSETRSSLDPDSLDVGFHFPGWSPRLESRSMLVQMRFVEDSPSGSTTGGTGDSDLGQGDTDGPAEGSASQTDPAATPHPSTPTIKLIGLDVVGLTYEGEQWRLSTIANWAIVGRKSPAPDTASKLKDFCRQVFELFRSSSGLP